jgi:hypothetical protein
VVKPTFSRCLPLLLLLLVALACILAVTPPLVIAAEAKVQRGVFGSAGCTERNRFWTIARPEHLQYDPFVETLRDVDPKTGECIPPGTRRGWRQGALGYSGGRAPEVPAQKCRLNFLSASYPRTRQQQEACASV